MSPNLQQEIKDLFEPIPPRRQLEGWCRIEKANELAELIVREKPEVVVELGVFGGKSFLPMALALRENGHGHAFGIDTWNAEIAVEHFDPSNEDDARQINWWKTVDMHEIYRGCARTIEALKLDDWCSLIRGRSSLVAPIFALGSIDFLHIDGDHQEISSCGDVMHWIHRVRSGGYICFDDTNWPQVQKALGILRSHCESWNTETTVENSQWRIYRKK